MNTESAISIRVISMEHKKNELFERLKAFCGENHFEYRILQDEPYWKIENLFEIEVEFSPAPVWNYGRWSAAYKCLFKQDFTIEWGPNEDISLRYDPAVGDFDSYFVIFHIPSRNFIPKPSKTIRH